MDYNVTAQLLATRGSIGYLLVEVDAALSTEVKNKIHDIPQNIRTRILY